MKDYYKITIDDGTPIYTDDDIRATAEEFGVSYDDFISYLDSMPCKFSLDELHDYVKKLHE